jgi:hypothetical protein
MAPRWRLVGEDLYGSEHPGQVALDDAKTLQDIETDERRALKLKVMPPLLAPRSLQHTDIDLRPGKVTYYDDTLPGQAPAVLPIVAANFDHVSAAEKIERLSIGIEKAFYVDLFRWRNCRARRARGRPYSTSWTWTRCWTCTRTCTGYRRAWYWATTPRRGSAKERAIELVQWAEKALAGRTGAEKRAAVVAKLAEIIDIPFVPDWIEGMFEPILYGWAVDKACNCLNILTGHAIAAAELTPEQITRAAGLIAATPSGEGTLPDENTLPEDVAAEVDSAGDDIDAKLAALCGKYAGK